MHCQWCEVYGQECTTFIPVTIALMSERHAVKLNPNPNPDLNPYLTLNQTTQSLPTLYLFVVGDVIAGAIVTRAIVVSPMVDLTVMAYGPIFVPRFQFRYQCLLFSFFNIWAFIWMADAQILEIRINPVLVKEMLTYWIAWPTTFRSAQV